MTGSNENTSREADRPQSQLLLNVVVENMAVAKRDKGKGKMAPEQVEEMEYDRRQQNMRANRTIESSPMMLLPPPSALVALPPLPLMLSPPPMTPRPSPMMPFQCAVNNVDNNGFDVPPPMTFGLVRDCAPTSPTHSLLNPQQEQGQTPFCGTSFPSEGHHPCSVHNYPSGVHSPQSRLDVVSSVVPEPADRWNPQQRPRSVQSARRRHGVPSPATLTTGNIRGLTGSDLSGRQADRSMSSSPASQGRYGEVSPRRPRSVQSTRDRAAAVSPSFSQGPASLKNSGHYRSAQSLHAISSAAVHPREESIVDLPVGSDEQPQSNTSLSGRAAMEVDHPMILSSHSQGPHEEPLPRRSRSAQSTRNRPAAEPTAFPQVAAISNDSPCSHSVQSAHLFGTTSFVVSHPLEEPTNSVIDSPVGSSQQSHPNSDSGGGAAMEVDHPSSHPPSSQGHYEEPIPQRSLGVNSRSRSASSSSTFSQTLRKAFLADSYSNRPDTTSPVALRALEEHHTLTKDFPVGSDTQYPQSKIDSSAGTAMEMRRLVPNVQRRDGDFASRHPPSVPSARDRSVAVGSTSYPVSPRGQSNPHRSRSVQSARHRSGTTSPIDPHLQDVRGIHQALTPNSQREGFTTNPVPFSGIILEQSPGFSRASLDVSSPCCGRGPLLSRAEAGRDLHHSHRVQSASPKSVSSPGVGPQRGRGTMTIDSLVCSYDRDLQSRISSSAMGIGGTTIPSSEAPLSCQVDPDSRSDHTHHSIVDASLPPEAAAQPQGSPTNIVPSSGVAFGSHNNSTSTFESAATQMVNHSLSLVSNEACTTRRSQLTGELRNVPGFGLSQNVDGQLIQPSGSYLRHSQNVGEQFNKLSGLQLGPPQIVSEQFNQPSGSQLGLSQDVGEQGPYPGPSGLLQFPVAHDVHGSVNQPSGSYPQISSNVGERGFGPGSPSRSLDSDMDIDDPPTRQQPGDFLQRSANQNQHTANQNFSHSEGKCHRHLLLHTSGSKMCIPYSSSTHEHACFSCTR